MEELKETYPKWLKGNDYYWGYVEYALQKKFARHKAKVVINNERLLMIDWQKENGGSDYEVHYILDKEKGTFTLYGDLGEATACWYHRVELKDLLSYLYSREYFIEKITAGEKYKYDPLACEEEIREQMKEVIDEYEADGEDTEEALEDLEEMVSLCDEYGEYVYGNERFEELRDKYLPDQYEFGKIVSSRVYLWVLGFFMACDDAGLMKYAEK